MKINLKKLEHSTGFVLPVVLVLIVVLTALVVSQIRRGTFDQKLAYNSRQYVLAETAAQTVLRWCEARVLDVADVKTVVGAQSGTPAFKVISNWQSSAQQFPDAQFNDVEKVECLYEDASNDLIANTYDNGTSVESMPIGQNGGGAVSSYQGGAGYSALIRKYRITSRVTLKNDQKLHMQSELRFSI